MAFKKNVESDCGTIIHQLVNAETETVRLKYETDNV